jgi:hypothetical protein
MQWNSTNGARTCSYTKFADSVNSAWGSQNGRSKWMQLANLATNFTVGTECDDSCTTLCNSSPIAFYAVSNIYGVTK